MSEDLQANDRLMTLMEAAEFLGYKTKGPVQKLINAKLLPTYTIPQSKRPRVKLLELLSIIEPTNSSDDGTER